MPKKKSKREDEEGGGTQQSVNETEGEPGEEITEVGVWKNDVLV